MDNKTIKHFKELEAESIYVLREVAAQFERPVILFSGVKDSIVITYHSESLFKNRTFVNSQRTKYKSSTRIIRKKNKRV